MHVYEQKIIIFMHEIYFLHIQKKCIGKVLDILSLILKHTNNRLTESATKLTMEELKCWIGLLLLFGVNGKNDVEVNSIWSSGPGQIYHSHHATAAMSRNRFKFLSSVITFDDEPSRGAR